MMRRSAQLLPAALLMMLAAACSKQTANQPDNAAAPKRAVSRGEAVYLKWCASCHAPGVEHPGTNALAAKYGKDRPAALVQWSDLDPQYVKLMVRTGVSVMPHFRKTEISDPDLDALAAWLAAQGRKSGLASVRRD